jgi:hypothetical protein
VYLKHSMHDMCRLETNFIDIHTYIHTHIYESIKTIGLKTAMEAFFDAHGHHDMAKALGRSNIRNANLVKSLTSKLRESEHHLQTEHAKRKRAEVKVAKLLKWRSQLKRVAQSGSAPPTAGVSAAAVVAAAGRGGSSATKLKSNSSSSSGSTSSFSPSSAQQQKPFAQSAAGQQRRGMSPGRRVPSGVIGVQRRTSADQQQKARAPTSRTHLSGQP